MATKFNLDDLNPGVWFSFDEGDVDAGRICVRIVPADELTRIARACTTKSVDYKRNNRFEVYDRDDEKHDRLFWDYAIVDWENLEDDAGNPIPCTAENKVKLVLGHPGFMTFVSSCVEKLNEDALQRKELAEKNSSSTSSACSKSQAAKRAEQ